MRPTEDFREVRPSKGELKDLAASCEEKANDIITSAKRYYLSLGNEMTIFPSLWNENVLIVAR
jgi:arsenate reductase-like glutaredoxin family protein